MNKIYKVCSLLSVGFLLVGNTQAQEWNISAEEKALTMPVAYTEAIQEEGKAIFEKSCKMCHAAVVVAPTNDRVLPISPNLGAQDFLSTNSDGEIYAKITNGKGGMPPFKASMSDDERWKIVAYLRTFYDAYVPAVVDNAAPVVQAADKFEGTIKSIDVDYDLESKKFTVKLTAVDKEGKPAYASNVKVDLMIKRYFGYLPIAESAKTDESGQLMVDDIDIQPDTAGFITVMAQTSSKSLNVEKKVAYGQAWVFDNPLSHRELWGTRANTPLWLLITFASVVLGVWAVIGWAAMQLFRIWMLREK